MAKSLPWNWETFKGIGQLVWQSFNDVKPGDPRDFELAKMKLKNRFGAIPAVQAWQKDSTKTIPWELEQRAAELPDRPSLLFEDKQWTWKEWNEEANRIANWCDAYGLKKGDVVCLMMENRPEYLFIFYGLAKLGVIPSLINTNLQEGPLRHALTASNAKALICGSECLDNLATLGDDVPIPASESFLVPDGNCAELPNSEWRYLSDVVDASKTANPPFAGITLGDTLTYIFTSGTTGNPKPAILKHSRYFQSAHGVGGLALGLTMKDVMYVCLPLYHANGNMLGVASSIAYGSTVALRRKFSASQFWDDVRKYNATAFIYIGELCRYLINQPPKPDDGDNPMVRGLGNGLRNDIWETFLERFRLRRVVEFYGSSEGNGALVNFIGPPGAVGPRNKEIMRLAKWDMDNEELVRGPDGFAIECKPGEPGCLLCEITQETEFHGYTNKEATESKILHDVFRKGDAYFNTGDMLRADERDYLYFVDRLGDTFRWKGENVSTQEVAEQLTTLDWVDEATVYGVAVPGADGRAGMAALTLREGSGFDAAGFYAHVDECLPAYAQPAFVRIRSTLDVTGTFKHQKGQLKREGFDPSAVDEPLYVRDPLSNSYVPLTAEGYTEIVEGQVHL